MKNMIRFFGAHTANPIRCAKRLAVGGTLATLLLTFSNVATAQSGGFSFAVFGDVPYTSLTFLNAVEKYNLLIANVNSSGVAFGVHVGDIKAGNTRCDDSVYADNLGYFNLFTVPIIYTPGDNEWTDCHRTNNGAFHPLDRLAKVRSTFYQDGNSLGLNRRPLARQSDNPGHALYRENAKWVEGPVLFVTLNTPGSNNNHQQVYQGSVPCGPVNNLPCTFTEDEYLARNAANITWLNQALSDAKSSGTIKGVVVMMQANPFERFLEPVSASNPIFYTESGYADTIDRLRAFANSSQMQILFVNGDTHTQRTNNPLTDLYPSMTQLTPAGTPFTNFTRTEVYGQNSVGWTKVTVDPNDPKLFVAITPILIFQN